MKEFTSEKLLIEMRLTKLHKWNLCNLARARLKSTSDRFNRYLNPGG